jgi:hypothetical protein
MPLATITSGIREVSRGSSAQEASQPMLQRRVEATEDPRGCGVPVVPAAKGGQLKLFLFKW